MGNEVRECSSCRWRRAPYSDCQNFRACGEQYAYHLWQSRNAPRVHWRVLNDVCLDCQECLPAMHLMCLSKCPVGKLSDQQKK